MTLERPTGVVTFLFTDIEGSTRLVARIGDAEYAGVLDSERRLVVDAVEAEGGYAFGSEGDAHFAAFGSPGAGIRGAVAAQRAIAAHAWPHGPVAVRMGLHTGEARLVDGDYLGFEVHRAARVAAVAHGGQVVVSGPTRALAPAPGEGIEFRDLGEHRLKDVAEPERLYQVDAPGLRSDFPPPRTPATVPGNLPAQLTSFVGRVELDDAARLLEHARLLTLTGPGGTGKTRMSIELAASHAERFPDGAWFVPLAMITDPDLIASAIASAMGLLAPGFPPVDRVREHLRDRRTLLVLDNFEQVVEGAPLVGDLLREAPGLTVIASSRAPLRISGEQEFPVPPLSLPPAGARDEGDVAASEAGRLFLERARQVTPHLRLDGDACEAIAEIVRRLDGLPLAIELAAARVRLLPPAAMARRLGDRLDLVTGGGRDVPERQRTLRGAIDWSHDLLAPVERALFARLAVFAGGGPLEVVEQVCGVPDGGSGNRGGSSPAGAPGIDGQVPDLLERLAEQSLLRLAADTHGDVRFTMLETIREYAAGRLVERGEWDAMRDGHAAAFTAFASAAGDGELDRGERLDRLAEEHDNLRAALDYLVETGQRDEAAMLVFALWRFWHTRGHVAEGRNRVARVLAMPGWTDEPSAARLRALESAGGLAYWAGDMAAAGGFYVEAVSEARRLGDEPELANALYNLWFARRPTSSTEEWADLLAADDRSMLDEALETWTRLGDEDGVARAQWALGEHYLYRAEYGPCEDATTRALAIFERRGDPFWISWTRFTRSLGRALDGNRAGAGADLSVCLREFRASRDVSGIVLAEAALSTLLLLAGRAEDAYAMAAAATRAVAETGLHLATLWPTAASPTPDPETTDPDLRAALERGRAWSREDALDTAIAQSDDLAAGQQGG